jgi:hypothetical protein
LSQKVWAMNRAERLALVDHDDPVLPVTAQCGLLKVARSTLYYQARAGWRWCYGPTPRSLAAFALACIHQNSTASRH